MRRIFSATGLTGIFLLLAGCGLSDYERRMDEQHKRMVALDEQNLLLGDVAELPLRKDDKGADVLAYPFDVFLRLPKEISPKPLDTLPPTFLRLARYVGKAPSVASVYLHAGPVAAPGAEKKEGEWSREDYMARVFDALNGYVQTDRGATLDIPKSGRNETKQPESYHGVVPAPLNFAAFTLSTAQPKAAGDEKGPPPAQEDQRYLAYFSVQGNRQVAVIFQVPERLGEDPSVTKTIDWSLKSLDFSDQASAKRQAFKAATAPPATAKK